MIREVCQDPGKNIEKLVIFHDVLTFLETLQAASREFPGSTYCVTERETPQDRLKRCFQGTTQKDKLDRF